jgi:hypothetical protein
MTKLLTAQFIEQLMHNSAFRMPRVATCFSLNYGKNSFFTGAGVVSDHRLNDQAIEVQSPAEAK